MFGCDGHIVTHLKYINPNNANFQEWLVDYIILFKFSISIRS